MVQIFDFNFKNDTCKKHGVYIVRRPNIPAPKRMLTTIQIPGRDGIVVVDDGTYENIEITVEINYMCNANEWHERFRDCKRWLRGNGFLSFSDDDRYCYAVDFCQIETNERDSVRIGKFTVVFSCKPYQFLKTGLFEMPLKNSIYNQYEISHPIYKIAGEGVCTLAVNGNTVTANVGQNLTIDTDLQIAYRNDGTIMNTAITGKYQNLYLQEGNNDLSISNGFSAKIIPKWRV